MIQYPGCQRPLVSILGKSAVRIGQHGSSNLAVKRWSLRSRRVSLAGVIIVVVVAGFFVTAYAFHIFGSQT